jgi:hypothetical protein
MSATARSTGGEIICQRRLLSGVNCKIVEMFLKKKTLPSGGKARGIIKLTTVIHART